MLKNYNKIQNYCNNKKIAFTLSEILIALGVIGVVAALTLPSVINKINDKHFNSLRKKALSAIEQAYWQIYEEQGVFPENLCSSGNSKCFGKLFKQKLKANYEAEWRPNYSNVLPKCWSNKNLANPNETQYCISTIDNIYYDFDMEYADGSQIIHIDVNGSKKPNKWGKDIYTTRITDRRFKVYSYTNTRTSDKPNVFE